MSSVTETCRDLNELTPLAKEACLLFLEVCKSQGLNVLVTETYRSQARQNYLYELGRTRAGNIVTWTLTSRHTSRLAWDICQNIKGKEYNDKNFFKQCGLIANKLGITWGGNWNTPDTPHFEISSTWENKGDDFEMVTKRKVDINGIIVDANVIVNGGNTYIKLRDLTASPKVTVDYINGIPTIKIK